MSLYVSQQKSELLDSLETQVRFSQLVAVVVGARGLGKSFLLEQLHGRLKDEVAIANVDASMAMSDEQLDKTISLQLGLSWQESNSDLATRISNTHSEKVLITIDNAHLLSASCLEFILKLNQSRLVDKESSLFILLAGESSLPVMINRTPTFTSHPEMCVVFEVEPIQQSETRALVETFSHPNSEVLKELKNGSKLDYFWQLAKGNPAELNYHMSRWLDEHSPTQVVEIDIKTPPKPVLKAVVYSFLAITLSTMLVYQDQINQWISAKPDENKAVSSKTTESNKVLKPTDSEKELSDKQLTVSKEASAPLKSDKNDTQTDINQQFAQELAQAEKQSESNVIAQKGSEELKDEHAKLVTDSSPEKSRKTKKVDADKASASLKESQSTSKLEKEAIDKALILTPDEQFLLTKDSKRFVLQWAGVSSFIAAEKYRDAHIAKDQIRIYRRTNKGSSLFIIVSDGFSNRALAEFALNNYLQQGVDEKPWIKSLGLVHKEIRQFEQSNN